MNKFVSIFLFTCLCCLQGVAQITFQPKEMSVENKGVVYNKELAFDFKLHTNGIAIGANFGKIKTYYLTRYVNIEIGELKHNREFRQSKDYPSIFDTRPSRSFVLGKKNNLYAIRAGIGFKKYFSEKAKKKGLAIGINYQVGPTLGLIKPYYLEVFKERDSGHSHGGNNDFSIVSVKYTEANQSSFLDYNSIYGSSPFTKGLSELGIAPGAHGKFGVHFDWGAFDQYVKAFEAGIMVDVFFRKIELMVPVDSIVNRPFFVNLYLNLHIGKRR